MECSERADIGRFPLRSRHRIQQSRAPLFPSIPVIYYSFIVSRGGDPALAVNLKDLFIAGFLPGVLMIALVGGYGIWVGRKLDVERPEFDISRLSTVHGKPWELSIPVLILSCSSADDVHGRGRFRGRVHHHHRSVHHAGNQPDEGFYGFL